MGIWRWILHPFQAVDRVMDLPEIDANRPAECCYEPISAHADGKCPPKPGYWEDREYARFLEQNTKGGTQFPIPGDPTGLDRLEQIEHVGFMFLIVGGLLLAATPVLTWLFGRSNFDAVSAFITTAFGAASWAIGLHVVWAVWFRKPLWWRAHYLELARRFIRAQKRVEELEAATR